MMEHSDPEGVEKILETSPELQGYLRFDSRMTSFQEIFKALRDPNVPTIWVYGIGGVGKTTVVKQVAACAAQLALFDGVFTLTVCRDKALEGVKRQLVNALGLGLEDTSEQVRLRLEDANFLVIVDDVWKLEDEFLESDPNVLMQRINIPSKCKTLFTSRCEDSNTFTRRIGIGVLVGDEAWRLFNKTVGSGATNPFLDAIGKQVAKRCKGLPVLIVTVAAALSTRATLSPWVAALGQLKELNNMEPHEFVNSTVELICYNHLQDLHRSLFLLCGILTSINGDQIAISDLRREWSQLGGGPSLDTLIFDLKASYLLLQGESSSYVKMHDLIRYAAIEISHKTLDVFDYVVESSSTRAHKALDATQYEAQGSLLDHTRLSRLVERVVPDSVMKHSTLLKELKALKRMNDLVSLVYSYPMTEKMQEQWKSWMTLFSKLNTIRTEQLYHGWGHLPRSKMVDLRLEISDKSSQIQPILEDILAYLPPHMIEGLGKAPELKALIELKPQMETFQSTTHQYEPLPKVVVEFAIESATSHITTSLIRDVIWVGISGEGRHEVIQALKKGAAHIFLKGMFSVSVSEDWAGSIEQIKEDTDNDFVYLIDLHESVDVFEWIVESRILETLIYKRIVFMSTSPISCIPMEVQIRMEDHLLPWKLFCTNVGHVLHSSIPIRELAGRLVKQCGRDLTATILMARALRDESDVNVWKEALTKFDAPKLNPLNILSTAVSLVSKRWQWTLITKHCIFKSLSNDEWVDRMSLITRWRSAGLVHSLHQGLEILNHLVDAFLFQYSLVEPVLVRIVPSLGNVISTIFKPRPLVFHGVYGKVPTDEEWDCVELHLSNTDLSELPANPICVVLQKLLLQDNHALTIIPPCFFESMKVLTVVNLSNTSIKTLPESFFKLKTLTELVLRGCRLFMELPPLIGELRILEVLDLEGTEIIQLPVEVKYLINLTCLKVSFYGYGVLPETIIPAGILIKLQKLIELSIDVNPDDGRWEDNAKIVIKEVVRIESLKYVKLYLPEVEQVYYLKIHFRTLIVSQYRRFHFTVGSHFKRIMSGPPLGVEAEFDKNRKCLRYVHGSEVPIKELRYALQFTVAFFLDRHHTVTKLSQFGTDNMKRLEYCVVGECSELETIIEGSPHSCWGDYGEEDTEGDSNAEEEEEEEGFSTEEEEGQDSDKKDENDDTSILTVEPVLESLEHLIIYNMDKLGSIWISKASIHQKSFSMLKSLRLHSCPQLCTIFSIALLGNVGMLQELTVEDCESVENLVDTHSQSSDSTSETFLPNLKKLTLHYLPKLVSISSGVHIAPKLERMSFYDCPKLKSLSDKEVSSNHLKKIRGEEEWWHGLQWKEGRPINLASIFIPFNEDEDLMTQLTKDEDLITQ